MPDVIAVLNGAAVLGFVVLIAFMYRSVAYRYLSLNLVVGQLWALVSCLYLTTGQYTFELNVNTYQNLSPLSLAVYNSMFFAAAWMVLRRVSIAPAAQSESRGRGRAMDALVIGVSVAAIGYLFSEFIQNGVPLFSGESRQQFLFRVLLSSSAGRVVSGNVGTIALLLGTLTVKLHRALDWRGRRLRDAAVLLVLLLLAHQVLAGNKFSSLFWICFSYLLPIALFVRLQRQALRRVLVAGGATALLFGAIQLAGMAYASSLNVSVASRVFVLQGELWWAVHDRVFSGEPGDAGQLHAEVTKILSPSSTEETGVRHLMDRYGDPQLVVVMQLAAFTGGYPAIALDVLGPWWTALLQVAMGLLFGVICWLMVGYVRRAAYVRLYLVGTLFGLANSVFVMGDMSDFFKLTTALKLLLLAGLELYTGLAARAGLLRVRRSQPSLGGAPPGNRFAT